MEDKIFDYYDDVADYFDYMADAYERAGGYYDYEDWGEEDYDQETGWGDVQEDW